MTKKTLIIILSVLGAGVLLIVLFVGAILGIVFYTLSHSQAATTARSFLQKNEKLKQEIGEVKDFGSIITGSINGGSDGNATLNIKVVGERKTVNATVMMIYKQGRDWRVTDASYVNDAGQTVVLLDRYGEGTAEQ